MQHKNYEKFQEIENFIDEYYEENGISPSIYKIGEKVGLAPNRVSKYLKEMEANGDIEWLGRRNIVTKQMRDSQGTTRPVPLLGEVACGAPIFADGTVRDYIRLPEVLLGRGDHYLLTASGDSMIEVGIDDGDLVLVRQQDHANVGDIIVALIGDDATIKRYYPEPKKRRIRLHPENSDLEDIYVKNCLIQGIAVRVIKELS